MCIKSPKCKFFLTVKNSRRGWLHTPYKLLSNDSLCCLHSTASLAWQVCLHDFICKPDDTGAVFFKMVLFKGFFIKNQNDKFLYRPDNYMDTIR